MEKTNFIAIYDNVLSKRQCETFIKYFDNVYGDEEPDCSSSLEEEHNNPLERGDLQMFFHESEHKGIYDNLSKIVKEKILEYRDTYWVLGSIDFKVDTFKMQKTPPRGGYHTWHCEILSLGQVDRCFVWAIYLNDIPEGEGETEFLWQGVRVQPKAGTMVIWPAFFTHMHRGNPVYSCNKYILTGWGHYCSRDDSLDNYFEFDIKNNEFTSRKN